jgi:hypothetical protein
MSSSLALDQLIAQLAVTHNGLVPTSPLYEAGHCREAIHARLNIASLAFVRRGVRAPASVTLTPERHALAAALVSTGSWVSHTSALAIHGATLRPQSLKAEVSSSAQLRLSRIRTHVSQHPGVANLGTHFDITVSQPWWAIVESAAVLSEDELAVAMDSLIQLKMVSLKRLQRAHDKAGWYRGRATVATLLDDRLNGHGMVRSFLEQDLSKVLKKYGLPQPVRNFRVVLPTGKKRELDAAWPELRTGLEAHSWQYHSNHGDFGRTMIRDRGLTAAGWRILPVVVADTRDPRALIEDLRPLLVSAVA